MATHKTTNEECIKAVNEIKAATKVYISAMEKYDKEKAVYEADAEDIRKWENRSGKYSWLKNYGHNNKFEIHWGYDSTDKSGFCKSCAHAAYTGKNNYEGWEKKSNNQYRRELYNDGMLTQHHAQCHATKGDGTLYFADQGKYSHVTGLKANAIGRPRWRCSKGSSHMRWENDRISDAKPRVRPRHSNPDGKFNGEMPEYKNIVQLVCCGIDIANVDVENGNIYWTGDINQACTANQDTGSSPPPPAPTPPPPPPAPTPPPPPTPPPSVGGGSTPAPTPAPGWSPSDNQMKIGGAVLGVVSLLSSSVSSVSSIMML